MSASSDLRCINGKWNVETVKCQKPSEPGRIPKILAEQAYKEYAAQYGTSQSFDRLHERGGFGADELAILLYDRIKRLEASIRDDQEARQP
jgi:hypothetical protein